MGGEFSGEADAVEEARSVNLPCEGVARSDAVADGICPNDGGLLGHIGRVAVLPFGRCLHLQGQVPQEVDVGKHHFQRPIVKG